MALYAIGEPIQVYPLRDVDGSLICYEARYNDPKNKSRMWTWGAMPGSKQRWSCGAPNNPRPLYGLDRLGKRPDKPILITEGPKKADAAHRLLGTAYVSLSFTGGANAVPWHDYRTIAGKSVVLFPDADKKRCKTIKDAQAFNCAVGDLIPYAHQPGQKAMYALAQILIELNCTVQTVDVTGQPDGWDIADAEIQGWSPDKALAWLTERMQPYTVRNDDELVEPEPPINGYSIMDGNGKRSRTQNHYTNYPELDPVPETKAELLASTNCKAASDYVMKPIRWLWKGRIAKGKISLLVGNPGLGKSQLCASICAVVSTGGTWPVDRTPCEKGSIILLSSEDDPEDTVCPRLEAAGADRTRVHLLTSINEGRIDESPVERAFSVKSDLKRLGARMDEIGDVRLLIIDPISAFMGSADSYKDSEVRGLLTPLGNMAHQRNLAVLLIAHMTKASSASALLRVQGSVALVATARAVWGVTEDPENPARRLFLSMKNNLGKSNTGLAFSIESRDIPADEDDEMIETSRIMWEDEVITIGANAAMNQAGETEDEREERKDSKSFLKSLLEGGPLSSNSIMRFAKKSGYSSKTMYRAKDSMEVDLIKVGSDTGAWLWQLKGKGANAYADREN
jgi:energy-coupling factor transporter ATP-binding protein EcfA2